MMNVVNSLNQFVFFFQAEDGIRDGHVTGVQTCALPILSAWVVRRSSTVVRTPWRASSVASRRPTGPAPTRSEERRVGKECGSRRWPYDDNRKLRIRPGSGRLLRVQFRHPLY